MEDKYEETKIFLRHALMNYLYQRGVSDSKLVVQADKFMYEMDRLLFTNSSPEEIVAKVFEETTTQPKKGSEVSVIYDIVNYSTMEDMRKMLTNKLSNGWKLAGGLSVQSGSYFQAVTMDVS